MVAVKLRRGSYTSLQPSKQSFEFDDEAQTDVFTSIVPKTDDVNVPSFTIRVFILGTLWNILLATGNSILAFRTTPFIIPISVATLLAYPMGILMARVLSKHLYQTFGVQWSFNPGPFSVKEHALITIIASAGGMMHMY